MARVVRSALGRDFAAFDRLVHDAADQLAPLRDAHAALATIDQLRRTAEPSAELDRVRRGHEVGAGETTSGVDDPRLAAARALLDAARDHVDAWDLPPGPTALLAGIEATYRRGRKDLRRAQRAPSDERLHDWRKRVKRLWYQVRLIEAAAPSVLSPLADALADLSDALGDDHDLAVIVAHVEDDPKRFGGKRAAQHAVELARRQQTELRRRAFRLGATVYAESSAAFGERIGRYWRLAAEHGPELAIGGIADLARRSEPASTTIERERKFLVETLPALPEQARHLRQGYLAVDGFVSVRVRDAGDAGCSLTIKAGRGAVRTELEWPITPEQFAAAWDHTDGRRIDKTRYVVDLDDGVAAEVDVFHGPHAGLVLVEVEFADDATMAGFTPPAWFGREVTDEASFTNAALAAAARHS